jgi:hypothetical protein
MTGYWLNGMKDMNGVGGSAIASLRMTGDWDGLKEDIGSWLGAWF